jgi:hypothetical protein
MLLVHGTGGPPRSEDSLWLEWVTSMQDGLALAGHQPCDLDVTFVDLDQDRPDGTGPGPGAVTGWEMNVARRWWRAASFGREWPAPPDLADPAALLGTLSWSRFFAGIPAGELLATIRMMRALLAGEAAGQSAVRKVAGALRPDVEVVIGHALGSLAAVGALRRHRDHQVASLVTVGMPSGLRDSGRPAAARWVNVIDRGDTMALGRATEPGRSGQDRDVWLECDPRLRSPRNYLASPEFGDVLAAALLSPV